MFQQFVVTNDSQQLEQKIRPYISQVMMVIKRNSIYKEPSYFLNIVKLARNFRFEYLGYMKG